MTATMPDDFRTRFADYGGVVAVSLLCVGIFAGPLMLGSVHPGPRMALEGLGVLATIVWAASAQRPALLLLVPIGAALSIAVQLIPWPLSSLHSIAPLPTQLWLTAVDNGPLRFGRISINPGGTVVGGARLMLGLAIVAMVADLARQLAFRQAISIALAGVGITIWALGIAFPAPGNSAELLGFISINGPFADRGRTPIDHPVATSASGYPAWYSVSEKRYLADEWVVGDGYGPYVISNHFASALCLTLPIAVAIWMAASRPHFSNTARVGGALAALMAAIWTVAIAGSRAGTGAMLLASVTVLAWTIDRGRVRATVACVAAACASMLLGFFVFFHGATENIETWFPAALQPHVKELIGDHRRLATQVAMRMFAGSPLFGTGLGTYGDLNPVILGNGEPWYFAHNDYAQWLGETGLVGGIAAAGFFGMLAWVFIGWRRQQSPNQILEAGPWAAVAALASHSGFDFNVHVPANGFLACVVAGLTLATAPWPRTVDGSRSWLRIAAATGWVFALAATASLLFRDGLSEAKQRHLRTVLVADRIVIPESKPAPTVAEFKAALADGERMAAWDPWNAQLAALLGQANLHLSARPLTIDDANAHYQAAFRWFSKARLDCPVCRGVAEPVPRGVPRNAPR